MARALLWVVVLRQAFHYAHVNLGAKNPREVMKLSQRPRICVASLRSFKFFAGWCADYEFEDVVAAVDDAERFDLTPGPTFKASDWVIQRLLFRPGVRQLGRRMNPGLVPINLEHDYDLFFYICMNPFEIVYLNGIRGWRERCKKTVVYLLEAYAGQMDELGFHLKMLKEFDHVCIGILGSTEPIQRVLGKPCHYVPFAVDALRFTPFFKPAPRSIDVYSLGRRVEWSHQALLKLHRHNDIFYIYDTIPSALLLPSDYVQHRDLVAGIAKRSRFFVAYPAKVDVPGETGGQSESGARYYEGAASGTVMIGATPTGASYKKEFDWPHATIDINDEDTLRYWLNEARCNPERLDAISHRNAVEGLKRHDWVYRWRQILEIAGLPPTQKLLDRERVLNELAQSGRA